MPIFSLQAIGMTDPPPLDGQRVLGHILDAPIDVFVINAGMASGQPSVAFCIPAADETGTGVICIETSLGALLTLAAGAQAMAEAQFGWVRPL